MKGILLAGGAGTRLHPLTLIVSKQLLPVYDKPMVYYSLGTLMLCGIREVLIVSTPRDLPAFRSLLGDGHQLGCKFSYKVQQQPRGLPDALLLGEDFIADEAVALMLGDNIFHGAGLAGQLQSCTKPNGSTILAYHVDNPKPYGVITFDKEGKAIDIEEKPENPRSKYIVPGLYFYEKGVVDIAKSLKPSQRGELEIVDIHLHYLRAGRLNINRLPRGVAWIDTGTFSSLIAASQFVQTIEERQGLKIGCIEEIAYHMGYIKVEQLRKLALNQKKSGYGDYLLSLIS